MRERTGRTNLPFTYVRNFIHPTEKGKQVLPRMLLQEHRDCDRYQGDTQDLKSTLNIYPVCQEYPQQEIAAQLSPNDSCTEDPGVGRVKDAGRNQDHGPQEQQYVDAVYAVHGALAPNQHTKDPNRYKNP